MLVSASRRNELYTGLGSPQWRSLHDPAFLQPPTVNRRQLSFAGGAEEIRAIALLQNKLRDALGLATEHACGSPWLRAFTGSFRESPAGPGDERARTRKTVGYAPQIDSHLPRKFRPPAILENRRRRPGKMMTPVRGILRHQHPAAFRMEHTAPPASISGAGVRALRSSAGCPHECRLRPRSLPPPQPPKRATAPVRSAAAR